MKINIKPSRCNYFVNEEKGKVICVIPDTQYLFLDYIEDFDLKLNYYNKLLRKMILPTQFVGIASCNKEDEFDVELGKRIAFNKAKAKLNNSFFKRAQYYINNVDEAFSKMVSSFNEYGSRLTANAERRDEAIKKLLDMKEAEQK